MTKEPGHKVEIFNYFEIRKPGEISHVKGKQSPLFGTDGEEHKNVSYNLVFIPTYQHKYTVAKDLD